MRSLLLASTFIAAALPAHAVELSESYENAMNFLTTVSVDLDEVRKFGGYASPEAVELCMGAGAATIYAMQIKIEVLQHIQSGKSSTETADMLRNEAFELASGNKYFDAYVYSLNPDYLKTEADQIFNPAILSFNIINANDEYSQSELAQLKIMMGSLAVETANQAVIGCLTSDYPLMVGYVSGLMVAGSIEDRYAK